MPSVTTTLSAAEKACLADAGCAQCDTGIDTACCVENTPSSLTVQISCSAGTCSSSTGTLTYNAGTQKWSGSVVFGGCGGTLAIDLYCTGGFTWAIDVSNKCSHSLVSPATSNCAPFLQVFTIPASTCCDAMPPETLTVTITE